MRMNQPVHLVLAWDSAESGKLRQDPHLLTKKQQWLHYPDKKCGGLPGVLPLGVGMRVRLTEHLDKHRDLGLLKHLEGEVIGWEEHKDEPPKHSMHGVFKHMPHVVYVKFQATKEFHFDGLPPNVVMIKPKTKRWDLDAKGGARARVMQQPVQRVQFPLTAA